MATFNSFDALKNYVNKKEEEISAGASCSILICINPFNYNWRETKKYALATAGLKVREISFVMDSILYKEVEYILHFSRQRGKRYYKQTYKRDDFGTSGPQRALMSIYRYLIHQTNLEKYSKFDGAYVKNWEVEWSVWEKEMEDAIQEYFKIVQEK